MPPPSPGVRNWVRELPLPEIDDDDGSGIGPLDSDFRANRRPHHEPTFPPPKEVQYPPASSVNGSGSADLSSRSQISTDGILSAMPTPAGSLARHGKDETGWHKKPAFAPKVFMPSRKYQNGYTLPRSSRQQSKSRSKSKKGQFMHSRYELIEISQEKLGSTLAKSALRIYEELFGGCVFSFTVGRAADMVRIGVYRMFVLTGTMENAPIPEMEGVDEEATDREALAVMFVVENEQEKSLHCDYWAVKQKNESHGVIMSNLFKSLLREQGYLWLSAECEPQLLKPYTKAGAVDTCLNYFFINADNRFFPMHFILWPLQDGLDTSLTRIRDTAAVIIQDLRFKVHGISNCPVEGKPPKTLKRVDPLEALMKSRKTKDKPLPTAEESEPTQECGCFIIPLWGLMLRRAFGRKQPTTSSSTTTTVA